ncbi:MAG: LysR family transcriptional regulator substrate-binding protein [Woeseiaceae bacterium]
MSTIGPNRFRDLLPRFKRDNPGIELALHEGVLEDMARQLDSNNLDLAVLSSPDSLAETYRTLPLYHERYVVIFAKGHRFERMPVVRLADVSGEPYVDRLACELREMVLSVCEERGVELYAKFRSVREDWVQSMVLAGIGFAIMPEDSVTQVGLLSRPLTEPEVSRSVELVWMPGRQFTPAARAFVNSVRRENTGAD